MTIKQHIDWQVSATDIQNLPTHYELGLGETRDVSPLLATHYTSDDTGEFQLSLLGNGVFDEFPADGLAVASTNTIVRFLRNGESPLSTLAIGADSFLYMMSLDCKTIIRHKQICETGVFWIDSISCDRAGNLWVKDTSGTITVLDRMFKVISTTRLDSTALFTVADPYRMVFWQVLPGSIKMLKMSDLSVVFSLATPVTVESVIAHDFSASSGNFFLIVNDGVSNTSLVVTPAGSLINAGVSASGVCQWGSKGALFCSDVDNKIHKFNGDYVYDHFHTTKFGLDQAVRIASDGSKGLFVTGNDGSLNKVNLDWSLAWKYTADLGDSIDVLITPGINEIGNVIYLSSTNGVLSLRDMLTEGLLYGSTLTPFPAGNSPSTSPVSAVMRLPQSAHVWARVKSLPKDNSSSSSLNSQSSASQQSESSVSPNVCGCNPRLLRYDISGFVNSLSHFNGTFEAITTATGSCKSFPYFYGGPNTYPLAWFVMFEENNFNFFLTEMSTFSSGSASFRRLDISSLCWDGSIIFTKDDLYQCYNDIYTNFCIDLNLSDPQIIVTRLE